MTHQQALTQTRESMGRFLRMAGHKSQPTEAQNISLAIQNVLSKIPDKIFLSLHEDPNLRLQIHRIKPKPSNENPSARTNRTRHHQV